MNKKRTWAANLARELLNKHGLNHWKFGWNNCKRMVGRCWHTRQTIELSRPYVDHNDETEIRDTILHEIAHALVGLGHGHDLVWKSKCLEIGARPVRCCRESKIPARWEAVCGACGTKHGKFRRPKANLNYHCKCSLSAPALCWIYKGGAV